MVAVSTAERAFGLLQRMRLPGVISFAVAILLLDLGRYVTHRVFHGVGVLWRVHEVHHSDPEYDVSTAGRFHPIEVIVGQAAYLGTVAVLGPPVVAVLTAALLSVPDQFLRTHECGSSGPGRETTAYRLHYSRSASDSPLGRDRGAIGEFRSDLRVLGSTFWYLHGGAAGWKCGTHYRRARTPKCYQFR